MKKKQAFTLIELLVVIAILGMVASFLIVNLNSVNKKSRDSNRVAEIAQIKTALEMHFNKYLQYPVSNEFSPIEMITDNLAPEFMPTLPRGNVPDSSYVYLYTSDGDSYQIKAKLETESEDYIVSNIH